MAFDNLSDTTVKSVVINLGDYIPSQHMEGLLRVLNDLAGDVEASGGSVAFADVTGKPATYPPTIGTTATTAKAGNYTPPNATAGVRGIVLQAPAVAAVASAPTQADFNGLLNALKSAGIMAS